MFRTPVYSSFRALLCVFLLLFISGQSALAAPSPDISIKGGTKSLRENVRHFLPLADENCETPEWRLHSLLRDAQTRIARAGEALGYYKLDFVSDFEMTEDCWRVVVTLKPGEPVRISEVRIVINGEGSGDSLFQDIHENPGIKTGDRLNHGRYETLKARFSNLAAVHGYFDGYFELAQVGVNLAENTARVELVYNTGTRYRFGEITIHQDILNDNFVQRYLTFEEGDPYNAEDLLTLRNLYNASNYFSIATVGPDLQTLEGGEVPINIQLDARKRHAYSMGAGVATDTGPRLLLGFEDRYVTRSGHSVIADSQLSPVKNNLEATYKIPMHRPAYEFVKIYTGYQREETSDTLYDLVKFGTSYTVYHEDRWLQTYGVDYQVEDSVVGDEPEKRSHLIIPSMAFARTKSDGTPYPMEGWRLLTKLSGSPQSLGSSVSFLQLEARAKYIRPMLGGRLLLRLDAGATDITKFDDLPVSVRFFAGGDASVRGYGYKSLGQTDAKGNVIGGKNLLAASIEYDYLVRPKWAVAAFYDQGDASVDYNFNFRRSVGLGVRWISPIGPVRIDVACALDDVRCGSSGLDGWGLHLSMGPDL